MDLKYRHFNFYLLLILCSPFIFISTVLASEKSVGQIIGLVGTVEYRTQEISGVNKFKKKNFKLKSASFEPVSKWQIAKFNGKVYPSQEYRTKVGSRLKIKLEDNSLFALGPDSKISINFYKVNKTQKLRKGLINVLRGLSMYIFNKDQKNKDSFFKVNTQTATLSSRGTFGFISSSAEKTIVANKTGEIKVSNMNSDISGSQLVGENKFSSILKNQPPTVPKVMSASDFNRISKVILGRIGTSLPESLLKQDTNTKQSSKTDEDGEENPDGDKRNDIGSGNQDSSSNEISDSVASGFLNNSDTSIIESFSRPVNEPFNVDGMRSCSS
jgi:hypothetical protein